MKNDEILLRVKELIDERNLSNGKFADVIKMDRSGFSKRMTGAVMVGEGFINRIVLELGVNKRWLTDGVGEKYIQAKEKAKDPKESESEMVSFLKDENNRLSHSLLNKMNELAEVRDRLHKYELDELRSQISKPDISGQEAKVG